jgi:hypothetical protein
VFGCGLTQFDQEWRGSLVPLHTDEHTMSSNMNIPLFPAGMGGALRLSGMEWRRMFRTPTRRELCIVRFRTKRRKAQSPPFWLISYQLSWL